MPIKHVLRRCLRKMGWDVKRFNAQNSEWSRLVRQLQVHRVDLVFDVGANTGQFAQNLRDSGFSGRIVSFEAATAPYGELQERARRDPKWIVAPRTALGDRDGTIAFNIAANSVSSSALSMLPSHVKADPQSGYVGSEVVEMHTLDTIGSQFVPDSDRVFLKLDVQGFEYQVLRGATEFLKRAAGIQLELSLVPLYEGEHLFRPMLDELETSGFELWSLVPGFVDPRSGRLLQVDAVLFRNELRASHNISTLEVVASTGNEQ